MVHSQSPRQGPKKCPNHTFYKLPSTSFSECSGIEVKIDGLIESLCFVLRLSENQRLILSALRAREAAIGKPTYGSR